MNETFETRNFAEFRVASGPGEPPVIEGYAIVFNALSEDLGGFREKIAPDAVDRALTEKHDVLALIDHDSGKVLGRSTSGTLRMEKDAKGLKVRIEPPDTTYARDLIEVMRRGDVSQMSFAFRIHGEGQTWTKAEMPVRTVTDMDMYDVSVVSRPAYPQTAAAVRSLEEAFKEAPKPEPDESWRHELEAESLRLDAKL